jgi:putative redox protein
MAQTLEVRVEQMGPSSAVGIVRTHRVPIDRPLDNGGTDTGPLGGEYLLVALGGCFMSNLLAAIRARESPDTIVSNVSVALTAALEGHPNRVAAISMRVGATGLDNELLEKLADIAGRACIVTNTLKRAVPITVTCEV